MNEIVVGGADGMALLKELALDLRSAWNHAADRVWRRLDPVLWDITHNPWVVLQTVSRAKLRLELSDPAFYEIIENLVTTRRTASSAPAWFQTAHASSPLTNVAYFSMEFMLAESLPIYSGGLGNVAGDQLKTASDLGVPVVGIGLLYSQGYFRQVIDSNGSQRALFPFNDPGQLPVSPLRRKDGEWLRLQLNLPGYSIWLRVWQVRVGRLKLYLLDSNDAANYPAYRGITSELYGGDDYQRLMQELVLGIGGWRLLSALGVTPEVCHLNEGHAALAVLERARHYMQANACSFEVALTVTRAGNLFTTHTAVDAGFDRFPPSLVEYCLGAYAQRELDIDIDDLLALGRCDPRDRSEPFNMAYLAMRGSGMANGVSRLHGEVSRRLFAPIFPRWPASEVPITHVTNGVHMSTWDSAASDEIWTEACGKNRWLGTVEALERDIRRVPDARLWEFRTTARTGLVEFARRRLAQQLEMSRASREAIEATGRVFDPNTLTLGFARRFATYKRPNLLLHDPERLLRLLADPHRPIQLIIAGKAHPADRAGQVLIQEWMRFIERPEVRARVVFLSDYDMYLTERLVHGVDLWLNTPRRPWEACGTSGMKVLVNGGINLSELDGWWAEAYAPDVGWALGDGREHDDDPVWDGVEAHELYDLIEHEVAPAFYNRDPQGVPAAWVQRMRESMARLTPLLSSNRSVQEYTEGHYLPAAAAYTRRAANGGALGRRVVDWQKGLARNWHMLFFGDVKVDRHVDRMTFEIVLHIGEIEPDALRVELYAEGVASGAPERWRMTRLCPQDGAAGTHVYGATVPAIRPATDYTARVMPCFDGVAIPMENSRVLWQR